MLLLLAGMALSATLSFAQTPDRSAAPTDNNPASTNPISNEPTHRAGNWGWIGLIGLAGLAGMRGRREDARDENVRMRSAA
jgi:MYXO-CTERM domain-containing protein